MNFSTNAVSPSFCAKGGELIKSTSPEYLEKALSSVKNSVVESPKKVVIPAATLAAMAGVAMACNKEAPSDTAVDNATAIENNQNASKQEVVMPMEITNAAELSGYEKAIASIDDTKTKKTVYPERSSYRYTTEQETRYEYFDRNGKKVMTQTITEYDPWRSYSCHDKAIIMYYDNENGFPVMVQGMNGKIEREITFNHNDEIINAKELVDGKLIDVNNKQSSYGSYTLFARRNGRLIQDHYDVDKWGYPTYRFSTPYIDNPSGYGIKPGDTSYNVYENNMLK